MVLKLGIELRWPPPSGLSPFGATSWIDFSEVTRSVSSSSRRRFEFNNLELSYILWETNKAVYSLKPLCVALWFEIPQPQAAKRKEALNLRHSVYYTRYYIVLSILCLFCVKVRPSRRNETLWLQYSVYIHAYQLQGQTFSQEEKWLNSNTVETCGSCATCAMPPFINITTHDFSPAEHDINSGRVIWDWLPRNDNQDLPGRRRREAGGGGWGEEKSFEGQKET